MVTAGDGIDVGVVIGARWRLIGFLGQGAYGKVFRARDESNVDLGEAAVKVLHPNTSPLERANFLSEVKKIAQVRHQNLVAYLDSGEYVSEDGTHHSFLVTELCDYSLADHLASRPLGVLSPAEARELLNDLASGLEYLHRQKLLHRDLKPANVLRANSEWKLADFGLARDLSATGHYHRGDSVKGTPSYMAPELFESSAASPSVDVYALGVTIHQALTGRVLHESRSEVALIFKLTTEEPAIDQSLPPEWFLAIQRMCARNPAERPEAGALIGGPYVAANQVISTPDSSHPRTRPTPPPSVVPHDNSQAPQPVQAGVQTARTGEGFIAYGTGDQHRRPRYRTGLLVGFGAMVGAVLLVVVALLLIDRNGDQEAADIGSETSTADDGGPTDAPATTLPPLERIERIILAREDRPTGFTWADGEPNPPGTETCLGSENPRSAFPGIAGKISEFSGNAHFFLATVTVHDSVATARQLMDYTEQLQVDCDEVPIDGSNELVVADLSPIVGLQLEGADEFTATTSTFRGGASDGAQLHTIYARVGDITMSSTGTDQPTVIYHAQLMLSRATNGPTPERVEPEGLIDNAEGSDSATRVRSAANAMELDPGVAQWLSTHSNNDIDMIMIGACSALASADTPFVAIENLTVVLNGLDTDLRADLDQETFAELTGIGIIFYCPEDGQRLGLL